MSNMRVMTMAHIRNARGLGPEEKAILYTVESRGEVYSTRDTFLDDCGRMSKSRFYRHRNSLLAKGLLQAEVRRPRGTTIYRVNSDAVEALAPNRAEGRMGPGVETLRGVESNVLTVETVHNGDINVTLPRTSRSSQLGHQRHAAEDTKKTNRGTPQGVPLKPVRIGECYLRLVRSEEMNAWERVEYNAQMDAMTEDERTYWRARYEDEADLP